MDRQKNIKRPPNGACIFKARNILQVLDRGAKKISERETRISFCQNKYFVTFTEGFKTLYHLDKYNVKTENNCQKALESLWKHMKKLSCTGVHRRPSRMGMSEDTGQRQEPMSPHIPALDKYPFTTRMEQDFHYKCHKKDEIYFQTDL